jgi:hypothetical protein
MSLHASVRSVGLGGANAAQLGANEFLARILEHYDMNRISYFSSYWVAVTLHFPLGYAQRLLSRLAKRGLLVRIRFPRRLARGYNRGIMNMYFPTQRGRDRVNWYRHANSLFAFQYLATGTGNADEIMHSYWTDFMVSNIAGGELFFKCHIRDPQDGLLAILTQNPACALSLPEVPFSIEVLRKQGLIPEEVSPLFNIVAKVAYHCTPPQILLALLYRSARQWKSKCQILAQRNQSLQKENSNLQLQEEVDKLLLRTKPLAEVGRPQHDPLTCALEKWRLGMENSDLSREVKNLRWRVLFSNFGMALTCRGLTELGHPSPSVLFTKNMLTYIQTMNILGVQ